MEGKLLHENAHDAYRTETRGDLFVSRAMPVFSRSLGLSGECDVVEFRRVPSGGITVHGREGEYAVCPVEYKRGSPKEDECDILQLTAQVICLEEMLCCHIESAALFYFEIRHRIRVEITQELRDRVTEYAAEMHSFFSKRYLPRPRRTRSCNACSLRDICLPQLGENASAAAYNKELLWGDDA